MLSLTASATSEIRKLIDNQDVPVGSGIRIAADPSAGGLSLSLALSPAEHDAVVEDRGVRVFLDPQAAELLDDKALDAGTDDSGQVRFDISDQA